MSRTAAGAQLLLFDEPYPPESADSGPAGAVPRKTSPHNRAVTASRSAPGTQKHPRRRADALTAQGHTIRG